jgi:putative sterol carrier protein
MEDFMDFQYMSEEWITETGRLLKELFSKPSRVSTELVEVYKNCPDGKTKWIQMILEKGMLTTYNYGEGESPASKYKILGNYEEYAKVISGDAAPEDGLMKGTFDFEGNLVTGLTLMGIYKKIIHTRQSIHTVY